MMKHDDSIMHGTCHGMAAHGSDWCNVCCAAAQELANCTLPNVSAALANKHEPCSSRQPPAHMGYTPIMQSRQNDSALLLFLAPCRFHRLDNGTVMSKQDNASLWTIGSQYTQSAVRDGQCHQVILPA